MSTLLYMPGSSVSASGRGSAKPPKHSGRLAPRKDGRFQATATWIDSRGVQQRRNFYGHTQSEARRKRELFLAELRAGLNFRENTLTFASICEKWLVNRQPLIHPETYKTYKSYIRKITEHSGGRRVTDITLSDMQRCLNLYAGKSESTIKKVRYIMKSIFESARHDRIITFNPCEGLRIPEGTSGTHRILTPYETDRVTHKCLNHRFALPILIMLYAGLRRGEVLALKYEDIDLKTEFIHVRRAVRFEGNRALDSVYTRSS